jgi:hypothetical protein
MYLHKKKTNKQEDTNFTNNEIGDNLEFLELRKEREKLIGKESVGLQYLQLVVSVSSVDFGVDSDKGKTIK